MQPVLKSTSSAASTARPTRLTFFEPHRPAAPNLGRSVSEPRSLTVLGTDEDSDSPTPDFVPHRIPTGSTAGLRGRPRSATAVDCLSSLNRNRDSYSGDPRHVTGALEDGHRGRSPGPSPLGRTSSAGLTANLERAKINEASEASTPCMQRKSAAEADAGEAGKPAVTKLELGLRALMDQGRARRSRRGRSGQP